ncbi:class I SAM-dependent methyltransferase [Novosphingobium tardum]|uniref:Class I SAM-dependent methyltransferase n=1 Tax=Novosphingobium tardum TaxID=1538021 RepID=A0ABV8RKQ7_9SPHN
MEYSIKGREALERASRQEGNTRWWTDQTMSYDWKAPIPADPFSAEWFDASDARFLHAARLFTGEENPFSGLMDLASLAGKRVIEIGCGMGYHSELLARSGAHLTSFDISPTSVEATRRRLELRGLKAEVELLDAESVDQTIPASSVDLVWSWGVIHHSAHTARIVRRLHGLLKPEGRLKLMVYHLGGMSAYYTIVRRYLAGFWMGRALDDMLWKDADGFTARFYTRDAWSDLLLAFFDKVEVRVFGQDADVVMLPRQVRRPFLSLIPRKHQIALAAHRGSMIYAEASQPN